MRSALGYFALAGIVSAMVLGTSCKKDKAPVATTPAQNTPPAGGFKGLFSSSVLYSISGTSSYSTAYASNNQAYFSANFFTNLTDASGQLVNMGTVSLNNVIFKNGGSFYTDSTSMFQPPPAVWKTTGNALPAISFTNPNAYPTFTGYGSWPDTITKSQGLTLNLNGISGADQMRFYVFGANSTNIITGGQPASSTSITWPSSALNTLSTGTTATIQMEVYKNNIQTINGDLINFRTTSVYVKTVGVKN